MDVIEIGKIVLLCLFAYLFGSIPFGYIIAWAKGVNIQKSGSGNIGGTNVGRTLGRKYGFWAGTLDAWKGAVPLIMAMYFFKSTWWIVGLVFLFCMLGAVFSIWLKILKGKFRAGKGVGTLVGGLLVLTGWKWLILVGCWLFALRFLVRGKVSAASLILAASILLLISVIPDLLYISPVVLLIIVGLVWWTHGENIKRLIENKEPSVSLKLPKFFPAWSQRAFDKIPDDLVGFVLEKVRNFLKKLVK